MIPSNNIFRISVNIAVQFFSQFCFENFWLCLLDEELIATKYIPKVKTVQQQGSLISISSELSKFIFLSKFNGGNFVKMISCSML